MRFSLLLMIIVAFSSCKDFLPDNMDTLGSDSRFTQSSYRPVLGRNTLMDNNFNAGNASQPLTFKIMDIRRANGEPAPELTNPYPVQVWKKPYLGTEKSLLEIEEKRAIENKPLFNIRQHNGAFEMWASSNSSFIRTDPDSGYFFNVEVTNSGGRRYFKDMKLVPLKERSFEPSNLDPVTGMATVPYIHPTQLINVRGDSTSNFLPASDVRVYFRKLVDENGKDLRGGKSIKFIFLDSLSQPINPDNFNLTVWEDLIHGFEMNKTDQFVEYEVAYPIPLITYQTKYTTTDGSMARVAFKYDRLGFAGIREDASIILDFNIFEKGDWEIQFLFHDESPKFIND